MTSRADDKMPNDGAVLQAAADWFARARGGTLAVADANRLEAWLDADERHRQAYEEVAATWVIARRVRLDPRVLRGRERALRLGSRSRRLERVGWLAAACLAVAIALGVGVTFVSPTSVTTYSTQLGETAAFRLADGSRVVLDTQSAVKVWSRKHGQRKLALLRGRAFFEVAPNKARPFVVHVGAGSVTAVGTAFDVEAQNNGMRVVLVEGKVRVLPVQAARDSAPVEMLAGQELVNTGASMRLRVTDVGRETTWRFGTLIFRDQPLASVVAELNRYTPRKIRVDDAAVGRQLVSGVMRSNDPMTFLSSIQAMGVGRIDATDPDRIVITAP